jgi:hypothetical protein
LMAAEWFLVSSPMGLVTTFYSFSAQQSSPVHCCWSSPALSVLVLEPIKTMTIFFLFPEFYIFWCGGLIFMRGGVSLILLKTRQLLYN